MKLQTCSEVISFAKKLEEDSAKYYTSLSLEGSPEPFKAYAAENPKFYSQIERAYYSVITDAMEGCFAFSTETEKYLLETTSPTSYKEALQNALVMENTMIAFYRDAAEQSGGLMADVPRMFKLIVKKRDSRIQQIQSLLDKS